MTTTPPAPTFYGPLTVDEVGMSVIDAAAPLGRRVAADVAGWDSLALRRARAFAAVPELIRVCEKALRYIEKPQHPDAADEQTALWEELLAVLKAAGGVPT